MNKLLAAALVALFAAYPLAPALAQQSIAYQEQVSGKNVNQPVTPIKPLPVTVMGLDSETGMACFVGTTDTCQLPGSGGGSGSLSGTVDSSAPTYSDGATPSWWFSPHGAGAVALTDFSTGDPLTFSDIRPASGSITAADAGTSTTAGQGGVSLVTGTATANSTYTQPTDGNESAAITVTGTFSATLQVEGSYDGGTTYTSVQAVLRGGASGALTGQITAPGVFTVETGGMTHLRVRASAYASGTASVKMVFSQAGGPGVTRLAGACTPYHLANGTAAGANATLISASARTLCDLTLENPTSTKAYLKLYDTAAAPNCASATGLKHVFLIPADANGNGAGVQRAVANAGEGYTNGVGFCVVGGSADNDATNAPAGVLIEASWK